jgi:hypothetical protein
MYYHLKAGLNTRAATYAGESEVLPYYLAIFDQPELIQGPRIKSSLNSTFLASKSSNT